MASVRKDLIHRLGETDTHHLPGIFAVTVRGPDAAGGYVMPIGIRPAQGARTPVSWSGHTPNLL